jgi:hypothetical protein
MNTSDRVSMPEEFPGRLRDSVGLVDGPAATCLDAQLVPTLLRNKPIYDALAKPVSA